jgi:hypothetical protein
VTSKATRILGALLVLAVALIGVSPARPQGAREQGIAWARNPFVAAAAQINVCPFGSASGSVTGITQSLTLATATFSTTPNALFQPGAWMIGSGFAVGGYDTIFQVQNVVGNNVSFIAPAGLGTTGAGTFAITLTPGGQTCGPNSNVYSDPALTVPITQPFSADSLGNYGFFVAPGTYQVTIGPGGGLNSFTYPYVAGNNPGAGGMLLNPGPINFVSAATVPRTVTFPDTTGTALVTAPNFSANFALIGPTSGGAAPPTVRALVAADFDIAPTLTTFWKFNGNTQFGAEPSPAFNNSIPLGDASLGWSTVWINGVNGSESLAGPSRSGNAVVYFIGSPSVDLTGQTAAIGTTTLASTGGFAGQYRVTWDATVDTAAGTSSTLGALTITYTEPSGVVQTITAGALSKTGTVETTDTGNSTTTVLLGIPLLLNCKSSTLIQYSFAYASNAANAMAYNLHIRVEAL